MGHKNLKSFIMKFSTCLQIQYKAIVKIWNIFISSQDIHILLVVLWFNMFKRVIKIYLALRGTFHYIFVSERVKLLKGFNPSNALGNDERHPRVLKELANELGPVIAHLFQNLLIQEKSPRMDDKSR